MEKWYVIQTRVREEEKLVSGRENVPPECGCIGNVLCRRMKSMETQRHEPDRDRGSVFWICICHYGMPGETVCGIEVCPKAVKAAGGNDG